MDANALPNDVPPELDNILDIRVSGHGKMKTLQHREGAALTSPGLKEHDGLRASERRSNNERIYTNLSMKAKARHISVHGLEKVLSPVVVNMTSDKGLKK